MSQKRVVVLVVTGMVITVLSLLTVAGAILLNDQQPTVATERDIPTKNQTEAATGGALISLLNEGAEGTLSHRGETLYRIKGKKQITSLPPGNYQLAVSAPGCMPRNESITIMAGEVLYYPIELKKAPIPMGKIIAPVIELERVSKKEATIPPPSPPKEKKKIIKEEPIYFVAVEDMPEPIGGIGAIQEQIIYPEAAKRAGVEGRVYVKAFVDDKGVVTKVELMKGIGAGCDEQAMNAVKNTSFKPGRQRGKKVHVQVSIPVVFKR